MIDTASMANLESLRSRPDVVGRLSKILDELIKEAGTELLGEYPDRLLHRSPEMEFPAEHPLGKGRTALLKRTRELVLANLAAEL